MSSSLVHAPKNNTKELSVYKFALSKSEWDLRLQQEQYPVRPPSPSPMLINQQQEKESYRPTLGRSKSSATINHTNNPDDDIDDFDENSAPILPSGSCVEKLKQLFVTKASNDMPNVSLNSQHRNDSIDSNLNRRINSNTHSDRSPSIVKTTPIESQPRIINKPTTIIQEVTPIIKKPIIRSQKTIDRYMCVICFNKFTRESSIESDKIKNSRKSKDIFS